MLIHILHIEVPYKSLGLQEAVVQYTKKFQNVVRWERFSQFILLTPFLPVTSFVGIQLVSW